ncbi:hypothetical protein [Aquimarina rhabdastrellae]
MKRIITLMLFCISIQLIAQKQNSKYYKHLVFRESPYAEIKGRIPITQERAVKENHYKLTYNQDNRLVMVAYLYGGKQISRRRAGMMDGFRNIHSKTVISYEKNTETRVFYDKKGNRCTNMMNVYKEVYTYDVNGRKIGAKFYDENNDPIDNTWNIHEYIWQAVNQTDVIEKRKDTRGNYVPMRPYYHFMTTLYKYSDKGILQSMNHIDKDGTLINDFNDKNGIAIDKATYDKDLNLTGFQFYNAKKEATVGSFLACAGGSISYDENGNCIRYTTVGLDKKPMLSRGKAYDKYTFDTYGNVIEIGHYGIEDEPVEFRGYTKMKFIYDAQDPTKSSKIKRFSFKQ